MSPYAHHSVVVLGAGVVGTSLALELHHRGADVALIDSGAVLSQASVAAAGMLAAEDPHNPSAFRPFSAYSAALYPSFLRHIEALTNVRIPFQTEVTIQYRKNHAPASMQERSIDPRQLASGLRAALSIAAIPLFEQAGVPTLTPQPHGIHLQLADGRRLTAETLVWTTGAWFHSPSALAITPRKGQMLRVLLPPSLRSLNQVHRSAEIYIVPRLVGPAAGTALIGATVEDAGFDISVQASALAALRHAAATLLPELASATEAPMLEAWAGLRPATADGLPILGRLSGAGDQFVATGHFRNGILLAPATALLMADMLEKKPLPHWMAAYAPGRFKTNAPHSHADIRPAGDDNGFTALR